MLGWEKELVGTYVSAHPLSAALASLNETVTHTASQLDETASGNQVVVAGVLHGIRPHTAKSGKQMAFAVLEDVTGTIELIIFPKTFDRFQALVIPDKVVIIYGKSELREGRGSQILVDRIADSIDVARSTDIQPQFEAFSIVQSESNVHREPSGPDQGVERFTEPSQDTPTNLTVHFEPPEPEGPWFDGDQVATPAIVSPMEVEVSQAPTIQPAPESPDAEQVHQKTPPTIIKRKSDHLRVEITRCGDQRTDIERLHAVHGTLILFQGETTFSIKLKNGGTKDALIDFPNDGTRDCDELRAMLRAIGAECSP